MSKTVLFISELPDNISNEELEEFFSAYKEHIFMIQIDRNQKTYDIFNTRKPRATIIFKNHEKAKEARENLNMRRLKGKALNIMWHEKDNSIRYNNKANIFIKGISTEVKPRDIYELFAKFGEIISTKICEDEDGNLLGYGYINYYNLSSAENAVKNLNNKEFFGSKLEIEHFQKKNERLQNAIENNSIYIKNIPNDINETNLKKLFSKFGKITFNKIYSDSNNRNFAIIVYENSENANKAKEEMNNKKLNENDENGLYVDLLQKKTERKRLLTTKIGDINNKLNQEFKNCNLYIKNLPYDLTEEKLKQIFSLYGEVKSAKINKFLLVSKIHEEFKEIETSSGFGFVCYTNPENAQKAINELNGKNLPGYEKSKRPVFVTLFIPKNERKQILNKNQMENNLIFPYPINNAPMPYQFYQKNNYYVNRQKVQHNNYRKPKQTKIIQKVETPNVQMQKNNENKDDEPNWEYIQSLNDDESKKDYLGEYLFKKIEQHPISHSKNLTVEIISRITGMILGIDDIKEIYDITTNYDNITGRINEALKLLEENK